MGSINKTLLPILLPMALSKQKGLQTEICNPLFLMARRGRFELPTF